MMMMMMMMMMTKKNDSDSTLNLIGVCHLCYKKQRDYSDKAVISEMAPNGEMVNLCHDHHKWYVGELRRIAKW